MTVSHRGRLSRLGSSSSAPHGERTNLKLRVGGLQSLICAGMIASLVIGCSWQANEQDVLQAAQVSIRELLDQEGLDDVTIRSVQIDGQEEETFLGTVQLVDGKDRSFDLPFRGKIQESRQLAVALRLPRLPHLENQSTDLLKQGLLKRYEREAAIEEVDLQQSPDDEQTLFGIAQVKTDQGEDACHLEVTILGDEKFELKWRLVGEGRLREYVTESISTQLIEQGLREFKVELGDLKCNDRGQLGYEGRVLSEEGAINLIRVQLIWKQGEEYQVIWDFERPNAN